MVPDLAPMLADRGLPRGDLGGWAAEPKLDGWRAIVVVDPSLADGVAVRTRRGHGITSSVPGIEALRQLAHRVVLDGEPYLERRERLEKLRLTGPCGVLPRFSGSVAADLLAACAAHDVEGIVLKRLRSIYRPGERTRHWRKLKTPDCRRSTAPAVDPRIPRSRRRR